MQTSSVRVRPQYARRVCACSVGSAVSNLAAQSGWKAEGRVLGAHDAPRALDGIKTLLLDCDGVLWRGGSAIAGTAEALQALRRRHIRLRFVTNNSGKSRAQYVEVFKAMGLSVAAEEIVAASYACAAFCAQQFPGRKVLLLGNPGIEAEMQAAGVSFVTPRDIQYCSSTSPWALKDLEDCEIDRDIAAVVVAFDPTFCYRHIGYAVACLCENPGCALVSSNPDAFDRVAGGRRMPGTGALVAAIETASGVSAVTVGKGGSWLLPFLCSEFDLSPQEVCIVGDRLDTDIALGKAGNLRTVLPLTGVTTPATLLAAQDDDLPDFVVSNLAALAGINVDG